ncbi:MAG: threonine-phosphate decarboxylase CobD [Reyranella sp.]|nr:threonine-phosphate decarboxylase CobD [Reyranella sp.]
MGALPITEVTTVKPVAHGGDLSAVRRCYPDAPEPWIDLSTGINAVPYPVADLPTEIWSRLPTRQQEQALIEAAAHRYGVRDPATIVAAPGTQALIQLLPRLVSRSRVAVVGPTYDEHEACWARQGHEVGVVTSFDDAANADVVVIVNPNNPTGRLLPPAALRRSKGLLVVDEAFVDLLPREASLAGRLPANTIVLRSFGKAYGLAGVRLGFAIAERPIVDRIRDELGPWAVSGPALKIGRRALGNSAWLQAAATRLATDRRTLDALLVSAGCEILGGTPLFCLARHADAAGLADRLARQGIHVRRFAGEPQWVRFGLPESAIEFSRVAAALA